MLASVGPIGLPGIPGAPGEQGAHGLAGRPGSRGLLGVDGSDGEDGTCPGSCLSSKQVTEAPTTSVNIKGLDYISSKNQINWLKKKQMKQNPKSVRRKFI